MKGPKENDNQYKKSSSSSSSTTSSSSSSSITRNSFISRDNDSTLFGQTLNPILSVVRKCLPLSSAGVTDDAGM